MRYVGLRCENKGNEARFGLIHGYPDSFELTECMPLAGTLPRGAELRMDDDFPHRIALVDVLYVLEDVLVVGARARELFESRAAPDIELLPVNVIDHKGRKVKPPYWIVNLLRAVDCVDKSKTVHVPNLLDPASMTRVRNLTIDEARIDPALHLFRPVGIEPLVVARRDLADALVGAGIEGLRVFELSEYTS